MIVKGPMMSVDARGGIFGTIVFSIWRQINYIRELAIPTNPNSTRQSRIRGFLTAASRAWSALTQSQRDAWNSFVQTVTRSTSLGQTYHPTGIAYYVGLYVLAEDMDETPISDPPVLDDPIALSDENVTTGATLPGDIDCSWGASGVDFVDIWITRVLSDGEHAQDNLFRHLSYTADATEVLVISDLLPDRLYGVRMRSMLSTGQYGPWAKFETRSKASA